MRSTSAETADRRSTRLHLIAAAIALALVASACAQQVDAFDDPNESAYSVLPDGFRDFTTESLLRNDEAYDPTPFASTGERPPLPTSLDLIAADAAPAPDGAPCTGGVCSSGSGVCPPGGCTTSAGGRVSKQQDGTIRYEPKVGFTGADSFTYRACFVSKSADLVELFTTGELVVQTVIDCDDASVALDVGGEGVFKDDKLGTTSGTLLTSVSALTANDYIHSARGEQRAPLRPTRFEVTRLPALGVLIQKTDGTLSYVPMRKGVDTFTYRVCNDGRSDASRLCGTATATIGVAATATSGGGSSTTPPPVSTTTTTAPLDDVDGDGVSDDADNCPNDANADQLDTDLDDEGDVCDATPGGGGGGGGGADVSLTIQADETWADGMLPLTVNTGGTNAVEFEITNDDDDDHTFWVDVDDDTQRDAGEFQLIGSGDTEIFTINDLLPAGSPYDITCDDHNHLDRVLVITG